MVRHCAMRPAPTCVWMDAGVVSYRLCDRDGDCAGCPLDAALRGRSSGIAEGDSGEGAYPDDRRYSLRHAWLQPSRDATAPMRLGLDAGAAGLLRDVRAVRVEPCPVVIARGSALCTIELDDEAIVVPAPIELELLAVNESLRVAPTLLASQPYDAGWIALVRPTRPEAFARLLTAAEMRERVATERRRARRRLGSACAHRGATAPTGAVAASSAR